MIDVSFSFWFCLTVGKSNLITSTEIDKTSFASALTFVKYF